MTSLTFAAWASNLVLPFTQSFTQTSFDALKRRRTCKQRRYTVAIRWRTSCCTPSSPTSNPQRFNPQSFTREDFDDRLSRGALHLAFIGMSNCGKSYRSNQLCEGYDFSVLCVDDEIERAISPHLSANGYKGIEGLAKWMGFPTDEHFQQNQAIYLQHEEAITSSVQQNKPDGNFVLDTTGSVIYLSGDTRRSIKDSFLVIHLEASDDMLQTMVQDYFASPKPVVWGDAFDRYERESAEDALRRCYPKLLRERRERYAKLAHLTIPGVVSRDWDVDCNEFVEYLRSLLKPAFVSAALDA